jgi:hypothetical protein
MKKKTQLFIKKTIILGVEICDRTEARSAIFVFLNVFMAFGS